MNALTAILWAASLLGEPAPPALLGALSEVPAGGPRAAAATRPLLGARYVLSPLGEGAGADPDPRFSLDAFDCMTFVETAAALGSSRSLEEARVALDDIRYEGAPALSARHHEVQGQWIPANLARGWIAEITRDLAGDRAVLLEKEHTRESWAAVHRAGRAIPGLPRAKEPLGRFLTWAVPPNALATVGPRIPEGTVVFVFREEEPGRATRVSHAGLVVLGAAGERLVRHATSTPGVERVIEEPLWRFARREERAYPHWPVAGYALYALPDMTAHVAELVR